MKTNAFAELLRSRGFRALFSAQFLGALNDNLYRMIVSLFAVSLGLGAAAERGAIALIGVLFILPYLAFSGLAGRVSDRFCKGRVFAATKLCEVAIMVAAALALGSGRIEAMLAVLFLIATQAAFASPARYGLVPEIVEARHLSPANGLGEMSVFMAIILGGALGGILFEAAGGELRLLAAPLVLVAIAGWLISRNIRPSASASRPAGFAEGGLSRGIRLLRRSRPMRVAVIGMTHFWFVGALLQLDLIVYGKDVLGLGGVGIGILQAALGIGIMAGCVAAGQISGDRIELSLVPVGAAGMGIAALVLANAAPSTALALGALVVVGIAGGLFIVPLVAFLQQEAPPEGRASLFATNNVANMLGVLAASGVFYGLSGLADVAPDDLIAIFAAMTLLVAAYVTTVVPGLFTRIVLRFVVRGLYRIRTTGLDHVPAEGGALLLCNHVSFVDGLLIASVLPRPVRFIVNRHFTDMWPLSIILRRAPVIPIQLRAGKATRQALAAARRAIEAGELVCIFPEGALSRTGNLLPFKRGFERIVDGLDVPVIPMHLDRVWGSVFSFKGGKFFWKRPERLPYPVTISAGRRLAATTTADEAREAIQELGAEAAPLRTEGDVLHRRFIRAAKRNLSAFAMVDATGRAMSYGRVLAASLALARHLRRRLAGEGAVGVMLPAGVAGAIVNVGLMLAGKVPVNLNFLLDPDTLASSMRRAGVKTVITSKRLLAKRGLATEPFHLDVEACLDAIGWPAKALCALVTWLLPVRAIEAFLPRVGGSDATATIIFSSGSTGTPKGVVLSHRNILSNIDATAEIFPVRRGERVMGVLPFFHSFGFSATLWAPLVHGVGAIYHGNPLEGRTVGRLLRSHRATVLMATPTFCRTYLAACAREDFATVRAVVVGAEKLPAGLAAAFRDKFGIELLEGYGATEMGPVIAVGAPDVAHWTETQKGSKPGTVGHPVPGVAVRVVDPETGARCPPHRDGLILVKGPGRFRGYLGDPEKTAEVMRGDWYVTGDIGHVDGDGFLTLTDRLSRFSKMGGEMVSHGRVEEAVAAVAGVDACFVAGVPDERKGERLVALYASAAALAPDAVADGLARSPLPPLWRPREGDIHRVDQLPILGTGKVDLKRAKAIALSLSRGELVAAAS